MLYLYLYIETFNSENGQKKQGKKYLSKSIGNNSYY